MLKMLCQVVILVVNFAELGLKFSSCRHRRTGRGGGGGGCSPPKILGNLDFLGSKRNLGKANYLRCFQAVF